LLNPLLTLLTAPSRTTPVEAVPNGFVKLGLADELLRAVADLGFTQPTLVQEKVIPLALPTGDSAARAYIDLMVSSQTGSGKTAAFLLPVLHTLLSQKAQAPPRSARLRACRSRSASPGRTRAQAPQAQGPDQQPQFQGRRSRRADRVPHA
jgi:hypothetical protein